MFNLEEEQMLLKTLATNNECDNFSHMNSLEVRSEHLNLYRVKLAPPHSCL